MKILVTGREGQVVRSLIEAVRARPDVHLLAVGRPDLDLEHPGTIALAIEASKADLIISAAAYTAVDQAEDEPEKVFAINASGAEAVARSAAAANIPVIHLSTDYVFSGSSNAPYREDDATEPQSVYGKTKLAGEELVAAANTKHLIFRTSWIYSPFGGNFVKTILRLAKTRDEISIVADQWGNPTSALDLAGAILRAADVLRDTPDFSQYGIYHVAGTGYTNWSGFARQITNCARELGAPSARIKDIVTAEYPTKARRPANSRLSTERLASVFDWRLPRWEDGCATVVKRLVSINT